MPKFDMTFARFGHATIEADNLRDAMNKAATMNVKDVHWSDDIEPTDAEETEDV